jgi:hypothetical protein
MYIAVEVDDGIFKGAMTVWDRDQYLAVKM